MTTHRTPAEAQPAPTAAPHRVQAGKLPGGDSAAGAFYDTAEAAANAVIGLVVSWLATLFVLGFPPLKSAGITAMFFALSFGRAWVLRRVFRRLGNG